MVSHLVNTGRVRVDVVTDDHNCSGTATMTRQLSRDCRSAIADYLRYYLRMNADSSAGPRPLLPADQVALAVEVFRMLADGTRIQILWALVDGELAVNELAEDIGKPGPSVSQHLAKLRMARLVRTRTGGKSDLLRIGERSRQMVDRGRDLQRRTRRVRHSGASRAAFGEPAATGTMSGRTGTATP